MATVTNVLDNALEAPQKPQRIKVVDKGGKPEKVTPPLVPPAALVGDVPMSDGLPVAPPASA